MKNGEFLFSWYRVSVWEGEDVLGTDGDDDCTIMQMHLTPLNSTWMEMIIFTREYGGCFKGVDNVLLLDIGYQWWVNKCLLYDNL